MILFDFFVWKTALEHWPILLALYIILFLGLAIRDDD